LEIDYQIGEDIKEKVIPRAIDYFTGKALEYDMLSEDEDDYDDEDDDDEDDEDADELDGMEDSDDDLPPARRGGRAGGKGGRGGPPAANVNPEECKQQ
jgi:nucleosome assembly protein 1-like 1